MFMHECDMVTRVLKEPCIPGTGVTNTWLMIYVDDNYDNSSYNLVQLGLSNQYHPSRMLA